jgi:hypothetical protein
VFSAKRVRAAAAEVAEPAPTLTPGAAVYLAAVLEYLCAKIAQLGGTAARDSGEGGLIGAAHLQSAV